MLLVNLKSGSTLSFDPENPADRHAWDALRRERQDEITGLTLQIGGIHYVLPKPKARFERVFCDAGPVEHRDGSGRVVADRIALHADDLTATVLAYRGNRPPMVRFNLERLGRPVYLPSLEGDGR